MAVSTAVDFGSKVEMLFELFDNQKVEELSAMFAADAQGVDEISKAWLRGRDAIDSYFDELRDMGVADIDSSVNDIHVKQWGDVALVTAIADQTYSVAGEPVTIKAPVSVVFHRYGDEWLLQLIHAVPLPEA